jgi:hypothetical protein
MAELNQLKKGDIVVLRKGKDATRYLVDDVVRFDLYIQEMDENGECYSAVQRSDISLATKVG